MREYELLKNEMLDNNRTIAQCATVMYTAVATILIFALQSEAYYFCLIPYVVIVPLFLLSESRNRGICKIAAYMMVFLEGADFHWETRHHELDGKSKEKRNSVSPYFFLSLTCSAAAIYKVLMAKTEWSGVLIGIAVVLLVTTATLIVMRKKTVRFQVEREKYIERWNDLKKAELFKSESIEKC